MTVLVIIGELDGLVAVHTGAAQPVEVEDIDVEIVVEPHVGSQSVFTSQFIQSKLILPAVEPDVPIVPTNLPFESIFAPEKSIHPNVSDQAFPPKIPEQLLVTPPVGGDKLTHP